MVIKIGSERFGKGSGSVVDSLFDPSGTLDGHYDLRNNKGGTVVRFFGMAGECSFYMVLTRFGAMCGNLGKTNGKYFYQHGLSEKLEKAIFKGATHSEQKEIIKQVIEQLKAGK